MRVDYHSHILPFIDDGAQSVEESIAVLRQSRLQGVELILATPHFYIEDVQSVHKFLHIRKHAYKKLQAALSAESPDEVPQILLGAEVLLTPEIPYLEDLEKLCIEGTNLILLELPFQPWSEWVYRALFYIISERNLQPIIAHLDRYISINKNNLHYILSMEVYIQINADSICNYFLFRQIKKWYRDGIPLLIGSDVHNCTSRQTYFGKATKKILRAFGPDFFQRTENIGAILSEACKCKNKC